MENRLGFMKLISLAKETRNWIFNITNFPTHNPSKKSVTLVNKIIKDTLMCHGIKVQRYFERFQKAFKPTQHSAI